MLPWPFGRRRLLADPRRLGRWGENQALRFLRGRGFRRITRNFRCDGGELDLVMADRDGAVAFVEVKTRRNEDFAPAQIAVTPEKRRRMTRAAKVFARKYKLENRPMRFDVVAVILGDGVRPEIRHYPNAFRPR
ncbi:MAG: YraN family protein [Phycisphaerae bacterium]|nr:YraN family protein [Phycisphaerae bacterium]